MLSNIMLDVLMDDSMERLIPGIYTSESQTDTDTSKEEEPTN